MTTLTIRSLDDATLTATLVRDVCHRHPAWVLDQIFGADAKATEIDLQSYLDSESIDAHLQRAGDLGLKDPAAAADDWGVYYDGPLYRVTSEYVDSDGTRACNDTAEALGDYAFSFFTEEESAQAAADDLASDLDEGSTVTYSVEQVR